MQIFSFYCIPYSASVEFKSIEASSFRRCSAGPESLLLWFLLGFELFFIPPMLNVVVSVPFRRLSVSFCFSSFIYGHPLVQSVPFQRRLFKLWSRSSLKFLNVK